MARLDKSAALDLAARYQLNLSLDYFETDSDMRQRLIAAAKERKYRDPKSALGRSRLYCFWLYLQKAAAK
ncbi:hypothetical protein RCCWILLIS_95 [Rhodobacter phage RcCWillis]|nr:hypothetical protein RCCWILLIS_95 [Rhodobacter phage RcCWillis]